MTTSQSTSILYEIQNKLPIPAEKRAYFAARLRNRLYNFIMTKFKEHELHNSLTKAELARRINRDPAVVTRLLSSPGNWRSDTASDLLLGICGEEIQFSSSLPTTGAKRNYGGLDWLRASANLIGTPSGQGQTQASDFALFPKRSRGIEERMHDATTQDLALPMVKP